MTYKDNIVCTLAFYLILAISNMAVASGEVNKDVKQKTKSSALSVDQSNPYTMVKQAADNTFKRFATEEQAIKANPNLLKDIVREELMPYINYKYSALKVIGKHRKKVTKAEVVAFFPVFREYLVSSYAQVFTLYDNQEVQFSPEKYFEGKKIIAVKTVIIMPGTDNIDVAFKVKKDKKTEQWQAFDMVAEGVSLLDSKQAELGGIIRQKGLTYVTDLLKQKNKRDIVFKSKGKKSETPAVGNSVKAKD